MTRRRVVLAVVAVLVLAGAGAAAAWYWNDSQTRDVRGSSTREFVTTQEPGTTKRTEHEIQSVPWPTYGFDPERSHVAAGFDERPPFRKLWTVRTGSLLEFPPVVAYGRLYVATAHGRFLAVEAKTGKVEWQKKVGLCSASSPTIWRHTVYQGYMDPYPCSPHKQNGSGFLVAYDAKTGGVKWRFRAGVVESSPVVVDGIVVFGSWDKKVYGVDARTGKERWSFSTGDKVKSGAAVADGTAYVGSYDGKLYALDLQSGKLRWSSGAQGGLTGAGNFYATPTVAYGRVYVGNTDGKVYAFGAKSGDLLWAHSTGGYVYCATAVADRTVYVGSYSRRFLALDAATGDERWSHPVNGAVSGAPTVLAGLVYFSTLHRRTYALDAKTGKERWTIDDGKYSPVVADGERVYLTGVTRLHGLKPRG